MGLRRKRMGEGKENGKGKGKGKGKRNCKGEKIDTANWGRHSAWFGAGSGGTSSNSMS